MSARDELLDAVLAEIVGNGLADRSLRDIAAAVGSSHRMLLYHFDSRAGLVAAVVEATEAAERHLLETLATEADGPADLMRRLWQDVASPERRPFVRLFFETVGARAEVTDSRGWLETADRLGDAFGGPIDPIEVQVAVAVSRGLLVDLVAAGEDPGRVAAVHEAHERFVSTWAPRFVQGGGGS